MSEIRINNHSRLLVLDYENFLAYHGGGAFAGAAIGFRAMEYAGSILSQDELWDRKHLSITTRHSGPGIRDAIEYVTRCVRRGRFRVDKEEGASCALQTAFHFCVSDGRQGVVLMLRSAYPGQEFLNAVKHSMDEDCTGREREELETMKAEVAAKVAAAPPNELFALELRSQENMLREHA